MLLGLLAIGALLAAAQWEIFKIIEKREQIVAVMNKQAEEMQL